MTISSIHNVMPAIHPGLSLQEILQECTYHKPNLPALWGSSMRISHVIRGKRPVTTDLALRFAQAFGQNAQYWMSLQASYDLKTAQTSLGNSLDKTPLLQSGTEQYLQNQLYFRPLVVFARAVRR